MQPLTVTAFASWDHVPFIFVICMSADAWAMIIRVDVTLAAFRADIFSALVKKYIVRSVCNLIESSWLKYQMSSRSQL
jgi:hypothetical protein